MRELPVALFAAIALQLSPCDLAAQGSPEGWGSGVAWRVSGQLPRGTISGLVLSSGGNPMEGVSVSLSGAAGGALTDSDGYFLLSPPSAGDWDLQIQRIGFRAIEETLTVPWDHGVFVSILLQTDAIHGICDNPIVRPGGSTEDDDLNIQVLDSVTGAPPETTIEVRVEHETGLRVNRVKLEPGQNPYGYVGLDQAIETEGLHSIEVSAPGYHPWRVEDVELRLVPGCRPKLLNRDHEARLVPVR